jgi:DNA-directed RNA polymerase specialized sigma24 family protein
MKTDQKSTSNSGSSRSGNPSSKRSESSHAQTHSDQFSCGSNNSTKNAPVSPVIKSGKAVNMKAAKKKVESFMQFRARLIRYAIGLGCILDLAEELVDKAIFRDAKYNQAQGMLNSNYPYMRKTVRRVWIDYWFDPKRLKTVSLDELMSAGDDDGDQHRSWEPSVNPETQENLELEQRLGLLGGLNQNELGLLNLWLEGYSAKEMAERFGMSVPMVNARLAAIWNALRLRAMETVAQGCPDEGS